jgi:hypothetical protein
MSMQNQGEIHGTSECFLRIAQNQSFYIRFKLHLQGQFVKSRSRFIVVHCVTENNNQIFL